MELLAQGAAVGHELDVPDTINARRHAEHLSTHARGQDMQLGIRMMTPEFPECGDELHCVPKETEIDNQQLAGVACSILERRVGALGHVRLCRVMAAIHSKLFSSCLRRG